MQYLCEKQLTAGKKTYYPGNIIADGVILAERSKKLLKNGYISRIDQEVPEAFSVRILIKGDKEQAVTVEAGKEEIQLVFSILQMNTEEGAKAVSDVFDGNVLVLLHAVDNRKMMKEAVKRQTELIAFQEAAPDGSVERGDAEA